MVKVCKIDPENGASDLQTFIFSMCGFGGIVGSITAMFLTELLDPRTTFLCYSLGSVLLLILMRFVDETAVDEQNIAQNVRECLAHIKRPLVWKTVIYLFLARSLVPHFGDIMYYFIINEVGFSKSLIAGLTLASYLALFLGSGVYNAYFKKTEYP